MMAVDRRSGTRWTRTAAMAWLVGSAQAASLPWEVWESPARFAALDADDIVVEHSSHCPDGCRYDRSNQGPESLLDNPYPQRWLYRDGAEVDRMVGFRSRAELTAWLESYV
jgi:hypothetical protein